MSLKLLTPSNQQPVNISQLHIGLICSVQCLFQQTLSYSRSSTLKRHNTSFPSFSWGTSPALPSHKLCRQDLNCIRHHSLGAQVWHHTEDIHLQEDSLDTLIKDIQILTKEFTSKGWAITPHVGQPCHLGQIPENYLVHWGQLHPWHSQKQINIKTIKQTKTTAVDLLAPTILIHAQQLLVLFGFWRKHSPPLQILLMPTDGVTCKAACVKWVPPTKGSSICPN